MFSLDFALFPRFNLAVGVETRCLAAQGVDRHLLGLKKLVEPGEEVPAIFKDGE